MTASDIQAVAALLKCYPADLVDFEQRELKGSYGIGDDILATSLADLSISFQTFNDDVFIFYKG